MNRDRLLTPRENKIIWRLLELASKGQGKVAPNPLVGAMIMKGLKVVGEGYHQCFGGPHAEIMALQQAGAKSKGATLYSTLEPCTHYGKTPPCTEAIINAGIKKVIFFAIDPNPNVHGKAARKLRKAGVQCEYVAFEQAEELTAGFTKWIKTGKPLVTLKAALSLDGRIADFQGLSRGLGHRLQLSFAHRLRYEHDAILVGIGTVLRDDPELTAREPHQRDGLIRIILDRRLDMPTSAKILLEPSKNPVWIITDPKQINSRKAHSLESRGARIMGLHDSGPPYIAELLALLGREGLTSLLVEGGSTVHGRFITAAAFDRAMFFYMPLFLGEHGKPLALLGKINLANAPRYEYDVVAGSRFHRTYGLKINPVACVVKPE